MTDQEKKFEHMSIEDISSGLSANDVQFSDIAAAKGCSVSHVYNVAAGNSTSKHIATAICLSLGKTLTSVFGDKYTTRKKRGPKNREIRRQQIADAIKQGKPVPVPRMDHM
ncbi:hypothetical protein [Pseudoalteromonas sp. R3]|uniref:hypothetical protein n=1 Tax=Pseudoalteromonas sp. R3 TaxID=1709477 RepID=UPI0006B67EF7|nr:hypothetical protein [Pseudoalteromonas sp. R3]AZZ98269.1 hypothetical protein ELR70_14775 [Pseudoalteromonas sp. R3]